MPDDDHQQCLVYNEIAGAELPGYVNKIANVQCCILLVADAGQK